VLETIGYDDRMTGWATAADATVGRVVRVDRGVATLLTENGVVRASYGADLLCLVGSDPSAAPCTGDWCVVRDWPDHRVTLELVLPRRTALVCAISGSGEQVLCANADYVAVVASLRPPPSVSMLKAMVALARESGARPLVVLTKSDLVADAHVLAEEVAAATPGVEVVVCSIVTGEGVARIRALIGRTGTIALLGHSGQGRSSLTNVLVGAEVVRRELVVLPGGGAVIDTPSPPMSEFR